MLILSLLLAQTMASEPQDAASPIIEVAARMYRADGRVSGIANDTGRDSTAGYLWSDAGLCTFGASAAAGTSPVPAFAWHFSARLTQRAGDESIVQVEWQRLGDLAARMTTPGSGSVQIRLRMGDRVELDHVAPFVPSTCQAEMLRLEIALTPPRPVARASITGGAGAARGGGGGAASGGTAGAAGGSGDAWLGSVMRAAPAFRGIGSAGPAAELGPTVQTDDDLRLQVQALLMRLKARVEQNKADPGLTAQVQALNQIVSRPRLNAEVWLVHRLPNGSEDVQKLAARFASRASVVFGPVAIVTTRGPVTVQVTAMLQLSQDATRPLWVQIQRRIKGDGPPPVDNGGGSERQMDLPKPDDVVSFEMPQLIGPASDLLAGHTFALRLQIAPEIKTPAP